MTNDTNEKIPKVSYSWKYLYEWCPRQFRYARVERVTYDRPKHISTIVGIALHRVVELMYKKKQFTLGYLRGAWPYVLDNTAVRERLTFRTPELRQKYLDKGYVILEKIYSMAQERGWLVEPIAVEYKFTLEVTSKSGRKYKILGKIDLILKIGNEIWVIDLKTGTYKLTKKELKENDQATIYDLAVKTLLKIENPKLGFCYPTHGKILETTRTTKDHEKVIEAIERVQIAIENEKFDPTYVRCFLCSFQPRCKGEDRAKQTGVDLGWFYREPKQRVTRRYDKKS